MEAQAKNIFLSYSHKDFWQAWAIHNELRLAGLRVWIDAELTPGTANWQEAINSALDNSACLICVCSPSARKSKWVNIEIELADNKKLKIYPALIRGEPREAIPISLTTVQFSDMRINKIPPLEKLINEISSKHPSTLRLDVKALYDLEGIHWTNFGSLFWFASEVRKMRLFFSPENPSTSRVRESVSQLIHHAIRINVDKFTLRDLQDVEDRIQRADFTELDSAERAHIENKLRLIQDKVAGLAERTDSLFEDGPNPGKPNS
jgi:hypothetical protein